MTDNDDENKRDRKPRSGENPRGDRPRAFKPRGDKPFRPREDGDRPRPPRAREDGDRPRSFKPRGDRPFTPREDGDRKPFRPREDGDRPRPPRAREDGDRPRSFKPRGDRPFTPREDGERKPFRPREEGDRPRPPRPREDGDRPRSFKPRGDRPFTPREDGDRKPFRPREDGDRKPFRPREDRYQDRREEPRESKPDSDANRIAKVMARAGLCSRRDAEGWIEAGRVMVNGAVIDSPALNVTETDVILVDGAPLPKRERTRLWLFHKPKGLVTTERDPEGRPTVFDNLPPDLPRVMSVGRLDINTEGLLLLTNDGGLARVLALPKTAWLRRYRVRVHGEVDQAMLDTLLEGTTLEDDEDGEITYGPIVAKLERSRGTNSWLVMDLREGKNREIKRVLEHLGLQVTRLIRVSFGPFQLGELEEGQVEEIRSRYLRDQLGDRLAEEAEVDFDSPLIVRTEEAPVSRVTPQDREGRSRYASSEEELPKRRFDSKKPGQKRDLALKGERPDLKVEREKVADRKGRTVKVERVVTLPREEDPRERFSRDELADPNRSFRRPGGDDRPRSFRPREDGDRPRTFKPRGDRPFSPREGGDRKPFRPREDGDRPRDFKPRGERPFTPREGGDRKPFRPREDGDRPREFKPRGERPFTPREGGDRKPFRPREEGDRPREFKPRGDRPFTPREGGDRKPFRPREGGDRKPFRPREDGDRPREFKPRGDRPFSPREGGKPPFKPRGGGKPGGRPGGGSGADRRR